MLRSRRPAFSMTGLLVLLAILAFLLALLAPVVQRVRQSAARAQGANNLRQIGIGMHSYHDAMRGWPPLVGKGPTGEGTAFFHILPYLEQEPLWRKAGDNAMRVADRLVPLFVDPQDASPSSGGAFNDWLATTSYVANWPVFRDGGMTIVQITDGTSNTGMVTQRYRICNGEPTGWAYARLHYWAPMYAYYSRGRFQVAPAPADCNIALPQAFSSRGIDAMFCDASVRSVGPRCSPQTWSNVTTPAGGEPLGDDLD